MAKRWLGFSHMKLPGEDIIAALRGTLEPRSEILFAYIFGSFIEESKFRDLDVGVFVTDPALITENLTYTIRLSLELEKRTGYPVDVILMNAAPDHLIHSISKGQVLVDRDAEFRVDWIVRSWKRYFDIQPKRRQAIV